MPIRHLQKDKCELFGIFGYIVQAILAIAAFLTLILKRCLEKTKRPWKVWWFDVSKQAIAAIIIHIINLILSSWLTNEEDISDECVWYFITLFLDCTLGAFLSYILMWVIDGIAFVGNWKYLKSGLYFEEYVKDGKRKFRLIKKMYFSQLFVWLIVTVINKCILLAFVKIAKKFWENFGNFILTPFTNGNIKLVVVMIIFPVILNGLYFWVSDNILKFDVDDDDKDMKNFYINNNLNKTNINDVTIDNGNDNVDNVDNVNNDNINNHISDNNGNINVNENNYNNNSNNEHNFEDRKNNNNEKGFLKDDINKIENENMIENSNDIPNDNNGTF